MKKIMSPWNNVKDLPKMDEHPDISGIYLNYYVTKMGQMVPLWPACGPMKWDEERWA